MDKQIIADIAADAAELGRQLTLAGIRDTETQAAIFTGAMAGIVAYETEVLRRDPPEGTTLQESDPDEQPPDIPGDGPVTRGGYPVGP